MTDAMRILSDIAYGALALLVALLVIYIALRLLGKFAKFVIILAVIALVLWFILSDHSILATLIELIKNAKNGVGEKLPAVREYLVP